MKFTILGSSGFIGSNLVKHLERSGTECYAPKWDDQAIFERELGHVIYCIGLTADFRERLFDTVEAHVCYLLELLKKAKFSSFLYLSSTRVYHYSDKAEETMNISVNPLQVENLYNISKLMGESICLSLDNPYVRVVRLSNVYGRNFQSSGFLFSVIKNAFESQLVVLRSSMESCKDYISIDDVVKLLPRITQSGKHRIYNIASGVNLSHKEIIAGLLKSIDFKLEVLEGATTYQFPRISVDRIKKEFGFVPSSLLDSLEQLVFEYRAWKDGND